MAAVYGHMKVKLILLLLVNNNNDSNTNKTTCTQISWIMLTQCTYLQVKYQNTTKSSTLWTLVITSDSP